MSSVKQFLRIAHYNFWEFWFNTKCPWCGQRSRNLELHYHVEHAGDEWLTR